LEEELDDHRQEKAATKKWEGVAHEANVASRGTIYNHDVAQ
jgi:hypothetical protein